MPSFLGGKSCGSFGQPAFFLAGNRMTGKIASNIYKWKEKVQKNTGRRRKVQDTKAAFKGLHGFVFFTAESLPCSETQPSK